MTRNRANQPFLNKFRWRHKDNKKKRNSFSSTVCNSEERTPPSLGQLGVISF